MPTATAARPPVWKRGHRGGGADPKKEPGPAKGPGLVRIQSTSSRQRAERVCSEVPVATGKLMAVGTDMVVIGLLFWALWIRVSPVRMGRP